MDKVSLVFYNFDGSIPLIRELTNYYRESSKFEVENIQDLNEVLQFTASSTGSILFFKVSSKKELQEAIVVLKANKKLVKKGLIKPACITTVKNKKIETVLAKYGCVDLLEPNTKAKTLSFKLDFWSKPIVQQMKKIDQELAMKQKKTDAKQAKDAASKEKADFELVKPLELQSDFWLVKAKSDYKKILKRWLIRLLGPSPYIGKWVELEMKPGDKLPTWKYVLKDPENKDYIVDDGAWFFYGNKPEFDWKIKRWSFSSDFPHLYFYGRDGQVHSRFKYEQGQVKVCENSQFATMREEMILETCDSKFNFEGEAASGQDAENLDGEADTDQYGNLEGKTKEGAEELGGDPLSGKGSTDEIDGDPLSGKSSTDEYGKDPLSGQLKTTAELEEEKKKKAGFEEDPIDGHMGGKSSTDELDRSPYDGKSATDEYGKDPLSGQLKTAEEIAEEAKKNSGFEEDPIPGHMGGKSNTDELGGDPLSGKNSPLDQETKDPRKSDFQEDAIPGHMGGKSNTDELGGDPLAGKTEAAAADEKDPRKSNFQEDAIPGHMGGKAEPESFGSDPFSGKAPTDDFGSDPLAGTFDPNKAKEASKDPRKSDFKEGAIDGHMGGRSAGDLQDELKKHDESGSYDDLMAPNPEDLGKPRHDGALPDPGELDPADPKFDPTQLGGILLDPNMDPNDPDFDPATAEINPDKLPEGVSVEEAQNYLMENKKRQDQLREQLEKEEQREKALASQDDIGDCFNDKKRKQQALKDQAAREELERSKNDSLNAERPDGLSGEEARAKGNDAGYDPNEAKKQVDSARSMSGADLYGDGVEKKQHHTGPSAFDDIQAPGQSRKKSSSEKEKEMADALGGGLTEGEVGEEDATDALMNKMIGKAREEEQKDSPDLNTIIGQAVNLNLESGELKVVLKQETQAGNVISFLCEFEDFYEDELITLAPINSLPSGSEVIAQVSLNYNGQKVKVACKGKIEEIEEFSEKQETLIISISNIDKSKYAEFMELYQDRQGSINNFMERAKGY